jgi:hypothetical protein
VTVGMYVCASSDALLWRRVEVPAPSFQRRVGALMMRYTVIRVKASRPRVAAEMALHVLAYNMTRVMSIMGVHQSKHDAKQMYLDA